LTVGCSEQEKKPPWAISSHTSTLLDLIGACHVTEAEAIFAAELQLRMHWNFRHKDPAEMQMALLHESGLFCNWGETKGPAP